MCGNIADIKTPLLFEIHPRVEQNLFHVLQGFQHSYHSATLAVELLRYAGC
jgi:hypothetical protein